MTRITLTAIACCLALAACGDEAVDKPAAVKAKPAAAPPPAEQTVPAALRGTYTVHGAFNEGFDFAGRQTLVLRAGKYSILNPHGEREGGDVAMAGDKLVFRDAGMCGDKPARYGYEMDGEKLRLQLDGIDDCSNRQVVFTFASAPWRRR